MLAWIEASDQTNPILAADKAHVGHCRISAVCGLTHIEATLRYGNNRLQQLLDKISKRNKSGRTTRVHYMPWSTALYWQTLMSLDNSLQ